MTSLTAFIEGYPQGSMTRHEPASAAASVHTGRAAGTLCRSLSFNAIRVGAAVEVVYVHATDAITLPKFRLRTPAEG